ncbi:MAG: efflux RND transporter permease subunit [Solirubrobacteraceae bacterium]
MRFRYLVVLCAGALVFFGVQQLGHERVDVFPEFAPTSVQIQTACLGLSASEVEELVTVPLEDALTGVRDVTTIRSESVAQLSSITLLFPVGTDPQLARQLVQERLQTAVPTLPTWAAPPVMMPLVSATSRIMQVGLTSSSLSRMDLSMTAYWKIRARLLRVPGVANVAIWGEQLKQLQVQADPRRMLAQHVSLDHLMSVTADALDAGLLKFSTGSLIGTGGFIETPNQRLTVHQILPISSPAQLAGIPVARRAGRSLRIGDVARVVYGSQPLIGDAVINGGPGLLLVVEKFPGANTLEVTKGVDDALRLLAPGLPGIKIDTSIFRQSTFIRTAIHNLSFTVVIGCILVVFVLLTFLFSLRAALVSLVAIPLSLIAAAIVLDLRGATVNTMVLAGFGVAVGVVVDDAIIDMENILRRLRLRGARGSGEGPGGQIPLLGVILAASLEVRGAILYATLINVVAVLPVVFVGGLTGSFFAPLALSYALAVLASMLVALTVTPALAMILLSRSPPAPRDPPVIRWLGRGYTTVLRAALRAPQLAFAVLGIALLAGFVVGPRLGQNLFPTFKEQDFLMHWVTKPGTSIVEERRMVTNVSRQLRAVPGVRSFGSHIGQAFQGEEIAGPNFGENWISLDPHAGYATTLRRVQAIADANPGVYRDVQTYLRERIDEVLAGSTSPIVVRIYGQDLHQLRAIAERVRRSLVGVPGLVDLHTEPQQDVPQVQVEVRLAAARRYGLKPGDVRRAAATLLASEEVGDIYRGGRAYDVAVWSTPGARQSLTDVRRLMLDTPGGGRVALGTVADVRITPTPSSIKRENASRRIDVTANLGGRDLGSVASDVRQRLAAVHFPPGYHAELLGETAERQAAQSRLLNWALAAGIAILLLLQAAFRSWRLAALLFLTLPLALVGGLLAAWAFVGGISLGALIGFFTVLGIAARNGIMMVTHLQHLERLEGEPLGHGLVLRGARERLAPILMTALATGLALLPFVIFGDKPGQEIEHPMAIVILGGLLTSTLLNLFIVPVLYLRFAQPSGWRAPRQEQAAAAQLFRSSAPKLRK